jgi:hypothetical protein
MAAGSLLAGRSACNDHTLTIRLHGVNVPMGDERGQGDVMKRLVQFPLNASGSVVSRLTSPWTVR